MVFSLRLTFCIRYEKDKFPTNAAHHMLLMKAMSMAIAVTISAS